MFIIKYRKIFYIISAFFAVISIIAVLSGGMKLGIDFTGGAIMEVSYPNGRPEKTLLEERLSNLPIGAYSLRPAGENSFILRTRDVTEEERETILSLLSLNESNEVIQERFNSIGPVIGIELRNKAIVALIIVILITVVYVTFVFRRVSRPVSSWKYGLIAILALLHDVLIPVGLFAILGHFFNVEVDVLFIMALLAILGYSVNDTIVVFDRVRENLRLNQEFNKGEDFELTVGKSLDQTFTRSVNTSVTVILVLAALYVLGSVATEYFALALFVGVIAGTYSSLCLATPLLVTIQKFNEKRK